VIELKYDKSKWTEIPRKPIPTLQVFITGRCNAVCGTCFFRKHLGERDMPIRDYDKIVCRYLNTAERVILIGGEPSLHPDLLSMVQMNSVYGLKTTIYTNGANMDALERCAEYEPSIRLSVCGKHTKWKSLSKLSKSNFPFMLVFTLDQYNKHDLFDVAQAAKYDLGCDSMYITSIRDIVASGNYWEDTQDTIALYEYAHIVRSFIERWHEPMTFHISRRGVLTTGQPEHRTCRYLNILPDGRRIICPWDISLDKTTEEYGFNFRRCVQNPTGNCILQKVVLQHR